MAKKFKGKKFYGLDPKKVDRFCFHVLGCRPFYGVHTFADLKDVNEKELLERWNRLKSKGLHLFFSPERRYMVAAINSTNAIRHITSGRCFKDGEFFPLVRKGLIDVVTITNHYPIDVIVSAQMEKGGHHA